MNTCTSEQRLACLRHWNQPKQRQVFMAQLRLLCCNLDYSSSLIWMDLCSNTRAAETGRLHSSEYILNDRIQFSNRTNFYWLCFKALPHCSMCRIFNLLMDFDFNFHGLGRNQEHVQRFLGVLLQHIDLITCCVASQIHLYCCAN